MGLSRWYCRVSVTYPERVSLKLVMFAIREITHKNVNPGSVKFAIDAVLVKLFVENLAVDVSDSVARNARYGTLQDQSPPAL